MPLSKTYHDISNRKIKQQTANVWSIDPQGAIYADSEFGTKSFFDEVEVHRYADAPWMRKVIGFDKYNGRKILEVGCGLGTDLLQFAQAGAKVNGIDLTFSGVSLSQKRFKLYDILADFQQSDAENLPFADNSFDVVYSFGVLHHVPDSQKCLTEIYRVLKPGGKALIMLYHKHSFYFWVYIILFRGIVCGKLLNASVNDLLSQFVEYTSSAGRPLVKVYSKKGASKLMVNFKDVSFDVYYATELERRFLSVLPGRLLNRLSRVWGWNLYIQAEK